MRCRFDQQLIRATLVCLLCACTPLAQADGTLTQDSNLTWRQSQKWFGGWSGAEISADGGRLIVVNDRGRLLFADLERDGDTLTGLAVRSATPLLNPKGKRLRKDNTDAEGLAIDAAGRAYVSFERNHRVMQLDLNTGRTHARKQFTPEMVFQNNSALEALAIAPDGTLYTLPERSGALDTPFPLYALQNGRWRIAAQIPRRGAFLPVGADFDGQGRFWLLERAATPLGFRSRIRRFDLTAPDLDETTLLTSFPGRYDNFEGLTLWQDSAGQTRALLISDDNFLSIQRTQVAEFILTE